MSEFQEIRDILKENAIQLKKNALQIQENSRETKELQKSQKQMNERTDKKFAELAKFQKQTSEDIRELKHFQEQTSKSIRELKEFQEQTNQNIDKLSKEFGSFTNNQGDIIEILFYNALKDDFILDGIKYDSISLNLEKVTKETEQEFDIILVNSNQIALIEIKGKAHENNLEQLDEIVKNYKILFPEHNNYKIQSYLGSLHFNKKVKEDVQKTNHKLLLLKGNKIQVL